MAISKEEAEERKMRDKRHAEDLAMMAEESDFLDLTPIWNTDADTFIIVGERCGGKTFGTLKHCIIDYKHTGKRFAYVRRIKETITNKLIGDLLEPFIVNKFVATPLIKELWGETYNVRYKLGRFEVYDEADDSVEPEIIGYTAALNIAATLKSTFTEEDKIYNVILDEFLPMLSERSIKEEYDAWEGLLSTLCRAHLNQSKVYLVGNSITKWSEYLYHMGVTYEMMDEKNQGKIQEILLPADDCHVEEKVTFLLCKPNKKLAKMNSKHIRKSRMSIGQGWEMKITTCIPSIQGEKAREKLICTLYDPIMSKNIGFFLRDAVNTTIETFNGLSVEKTHRRQFIVVRQTTKVSHYYNLTSVKGLGRNNWNNINKMFEDIKNKLHVDINDEILHTRVFAENFETGDILFKLYDAYNKITFRETF